MASAIQTWRWATAAILLLGAASVGIAQPQSTGSVSCRKDVWRMVRAYYVAASHDMQGIEGYDGEIPNLPLPVTAEMDYSEGELQIIPVPPDTQSPPCFGCQKWMGVFVLNATPDSVLFHTNAIYLRMVLEARDFDGQWRPIQLSPQEWSGHIRPSWATMWLGPGEYWALSAPVFCGDMETELRFSLRPSRDTVIYSKTFPGSINRRQFFRWRWSRYMLDPYAVNRERGIWMAWSREWDGFEELTRLPERPKLDAGGDKGW